MAATAPGQQESSELCVSCGLCCDGTLYGLAEASPNEITRLADVGMELTEENGTAFFRLPCRHHSCGRCGIYELRFDRCRSFKCALLRKFDAGDITRHDAQSKIDEALRLRAEITQIDPHAKTHSNRQLLRAELARELTTSEEPLKSQAGRRLVNLVALDEWLERWFRNKKPGDARGGGA